MQKAAEKPSPAPTRSFRRKNDYRPDIDGLRAIAVLSVVGYHAFPAQVHGGFSGVDIFFVISGFLISKHIWEDLAGNAFSLRTFYARRVRRIFPALAVVLLACLAMGWVILSPGEYEQLGKHVTGGAGFVSNIISWKEAGYFDNAADTKPLLHLWSLGIEEQFYILWPLILAFLWRHPQHSGWVLPGVLVASLLYSIWLVHHDAVADFYSPLTRCWELALGALAAHKPVRHYPMQPVARNLLSWFGLVLILCGVIALDSGSPFPGAWALLPAGGAACLIQAGEHAWLNRKILSRHLLIWIGLISYPLYLWHWPLLSFARIMESATPSATMRIWLVATSFVLAWLTYLFLERPVRARPQSRNIVIALSVAVFLLGMGGEAVRKLDGVKSRKLSMLNGDPATLILGADRGRLQHECGLPEAQKPLFQYCLRNGPQPRYALWGDSKAEALFYGLVRESRPDMQWLMIGSVYPPDANASPEGRQQRKNLLALQTLAGDPEIKIVALTVALRSIFPLDKQTGFIDPNTAPSPATVAAYGHVIRQLEEAGKRVVFVIDNPTFPDPRSCISGGATDSPLLNCFLRRKENPHCAIRHTDHLAGVQPYYRFIEELRRQHPGLAVYDPTPLLCDASANLCTVTRDGKFLYSYGDHISDYANSMIARDMLPFIRKLDR